MILLLAIDIVIFSSENISVGIIFFFFFEMVLSMRPVIWLYLGGREGGREQWVDPEGKMGGPTLSPHHHHVLHAHIHGHGSLPHSRPRPLSPAERKPLFEEQ